ncbi:MAG: dienelactone hydrolase family protein [Myxococcota bacterium]
MIQHKIFLGALGLALCAACGAKKVSKSEGEATATPVEAETESATNSAAAPAPEGVDESGSIVGEEVTYQADGVTMKGFLAYDRAATGPRPGVLVVHEWWGHNDYARQRARMLAGMGYTALAVDMYGDGKRAEHPKEAQAFAGAVMGDITVAKGRFLAAAELLKGHETTDPDKLAAIGYCFGGGVVLHMARLGVDLDAVVSFHGSLATQSPAQAGQVKAKVLVCNGADDPFVTAEHIAGFKQEMDAAAVDYRFENYAGATHSFTSRAADEYGKKFDLPLAYNADADQKSWQAMQDLFATVFK